MIVGKKYDMKDYTEKSHSTLSKQKYITKPEDRKPQGTKTKGVDAANGELDRCFDGKY